MKGMVAACPQWETNAKGVFLAHRISISYFFWTKMVFFYHFLILTRLLPPFWLFTEKRYFICTLTI